MSVILEYVNRTFDGRDHFLSEDKTVALVLAALLFLWLQEKKPVNEKGNRLLVFTLITSILLLCPFTAVAGVIYQTAFYDYGWLWSMVPVTIVLSYVAVLLYDTKLEKGNRKQKSLGIAVFLVMLFVCGNHGMLKIVGEEEDVQRREAEAVIDVLDRMATDSELVLWGPRGVMQEARRQNGRITLAYGRDMWEAKAGAYDYEVYSDSMIASYEWMNMTEDIVGNGETLLKVLRILWEQKEMNTELQKVLPVLLEDGVNVIVMPIETKELFEDTFFSIIAEQGMEAEETVTERYLVYRLK